MVATGPSSPDQPIERFHYHASQEEGGSRRQKATLEHVFGRLDSGDGSASTRGQGLLGDDAEDAAADGQPWQMGWQMSERNVVWSDQLKLRLVTRIASEQLGVSEGEVTSRLATLATLLPGLESRLAGAPAKLVARLAASPGSVAQRLLRLKAAFPGANAAAMINNRFSLLLDDDMDSVEDAGRRLRGMLPDLNVDKFVEAFPVVLDYDSFEMAVADASRIMPGMDLPKTLRTNPSMIMGLMKGRSMIPYDQISNPWS